MRILWMSDSPTSASGYGNVTRFICAGLARRGHDVSIIGWQTQGRRVYWRGCTVYPIGQNPVGADVLLDYLRLIKPDVLVTQGDLWRLSYIANPLVADFMSDARIPWMLYCPIDSDMGGGRLPPSFVRLLKEVALPIVVSRYGLAVARANGVRAAYIPYGVDTATFRPPRDKRAAKLAVGYEDRFVVLCDARNQQRKILPRCLEIFQRFAADKDDALLHLHSDPDDPAARTPDYHYDLRADIKCLGLSEQVRFTPGISINAGVPIEQLAALYRAADVHLLTSYGEGFGLPTLQAAASGVVPMASAYSASHELVADHGEAIRVGHFVRDQIGLRCALVDIEDAVIKLERLYRDPELLRSKSRAARLFAATYDWRHIVKRWDELLEREIPALRLSRPQRPRQRHVRSLSKRVQTRRAKLPSDVRAAVAKLESVGGHASAGILLDLATSYGSFSLPVILPAVDSLPAGRRVPGRVYLAGPSDLPIFTKLRRIFPGLSAWSTTLKRGTNRSWSRMPTVMLGSAQYQSYLATSVLALDFGGIDSKLPALAAKMGVPCIGLACRNAQAWLWPNLSLAVWQATEAARLARSVLTDHGKAARACGLARKRRLRNDSAFRTRAQSDGGREGVYY